MYSTILKSKHHVTWVIPFFYLLRFTTNWTSITKQSALYSTPIYPREPSICTSKSCRTVPQRRPQSQGSCRRGGSSSDLSSKGGKWEWWVKVSLTLGAAAGQTPWLSSNTSISEKRSQWLGRRKRTGRRQTNTTEEQISCCLPTDLWDSPTLGSPHWAINTPKAPSLSTHLPPTLPSSYLSALQTWEVSQFR